MTYLGLVPVHEVRTHLRGPDNPDNRHREVMALFGTIDSETPREAKGILFRLDTIPGQAPTYLIRSETPIEVATPGARSKEEPEDVPSSGTTIQFRIAVNGIQRTNRSTAKPTRLDDQPPVDENDRTITISEWLKQRLAGALKDIHINNHVREVLGVDRRGRRTGNGKVIQIDTIDGVAIVDDETILKEKLVKGVGRAKSYGCGLLTVRAI